MSKKQFDHIENKIIEAAHNSEPVFDELAWTKMESLLDKQDKDRRRPFAWIWFVLPVLLIGGTAAYFSLHNSSIKNTNQYSAESSSLIAEQKQDVTEAINLELIKDNSEVIHINKDAVTATKKISVQKTGKGKIIVRANTVDAEEDIVEKKDAGVKSNVIKSVIENDKLSADETINEPIIVDTENKDIKKIITTDSSDTSEVKKKTDKEKSKKISRFYLLASIAADAGSVEFLSLSNSTITGKYGVGIGYQFNKRLSIQTGFYAGHKKYVAGPGDYITKPGSYLSTVDIQKVNADCLIYEIPLAVRYNIFSSAKTTYYATTGLSSFIMKNEDYYYYYERYNIPYEAGREYTGNQNLFSVFTLSAGIEKKLGNKLFLQVEPSVSIPLSGVGEGKVKLYSATLQLGLKYQLSHK